jgi:uncharacterized membrane protein (DUF2068 family)
MAEAHDTRRSRRLIKMIAAERAIRGLLLAAGGIYLLAHLGADCGKLAERFMRAVELDPNRHFFHAVITRLHELRVHQLRMAGALALVYGGIELVEGVGLWLDQLWAEYLTVIVTSLLIPFELSTNSPTIPPSGRQAASRSTSRSSPTSPTFYLLRQRLRDHRMLADDARRG